MKVYAVCPKEVDETGTAARQRPSLSLHLSPCKLFSDVAYKARNREDLIAGIDEFLDEVIVLPPGEWDPNIRIEPPKKVPSADKRCVRMSGGKRGRSPEGAFSLFLSYLGLKKRRQHTQVYTFFSPVLFL